MPDLPKLLPQEIPFDDPEANCSFRPDVEGFPFVAWPLAIELYSLEVITQCLKVLQELAVANDGIYEFQQFEYDEDEREVLCFYQDKTEQSILALVASEF